MSGSSSESSQIRRSGSEEELREAMDMRKRKRMESNRESARRSRLRKQKHLDHLTAQVAQLKDDNRQILSSVEVTAQLYRNVEAENTVLRAQLAELANRLNSLNEIIHCLNPQGNVYGDHHQDNLQVEQKTIFAVDDDHHGGFMMMSNVYDHHHPWEAMYLNQPIMDMSMC